MNTRPSLGFDDDDDIQQTPPKADVLDLSGFQPKPAARPDKAKVEEAAAKTNFRSREAKAPPAVVPVTPTPAKLTRRRRTGRSAQLNLKVRPDTIEQFYAIADAQGWVLGEAFEKAVTLLEEQYGKGK
jgi:hypothetical protein